MPAKKFLMDALFTRTPVLQSGGRDRKSSLKVKVNGIFFEKMNASRQNLEFSEVSRTATAFVNFRKNCGGWRLRE